MRPYNTELDTSKSYHSFNEKSTTGQYSYETSTFTYVCAENSKEYASRGG